VARQARPCSRNVCVTKYVDNLALIAITSSCYASEFDEEIGGYLSTTNVLCRIPGSPRAYNAIAEVTDAILLAKARDGPH
jgi:hypothetical protein